MTHLPKRGDDDLWARVKEGDVQAVEAFSVANKQTLHRRKTNKSLLAKITDGEGEQWFDQKFSHRRRRRGSVVRVVAEELHSVSSPSDQDGVEQMVVLKRGRSAEKTVSSKSASNLLQRTATAFASQQERKNVLRKFSVKMKAKSETGARNAFSERNTNRRYVGALFDNIFVRPKAPRETVIKYEKHNHLLPLLRSMDKAHARGETNVATHMRNATVLTKAYPKLQEIDPNDMLESHSDRKKIIRVAEAYIEDVDIMNQFAKRVVQNKLTSENITKALSDLEMRTHSLAGPERYQCFHSRFRPPRAPFAKLRRRRRRKKRKKRLLQQSKKSQMTDGRNKDKEEQERPELGRQDVERSDRLIGEHDN
eukprot:g2741.t1